MDRCPYIEHLSVDRKRGHFVSWGFPKMFKRALWRLPESGLRPLSPIAWLTGIWSTLPMTSLTFPALKTFSLARSGLYFAESLPLTFLASLVVGRGREEFADKQKLQELWSEITALHDEDIQNIRAGFYPISVLKPASPGQHVKSLFNLWRDAAGIAWRMRHRKHKEFKSKAMLEDLPDYYQRNFHFQTDGYMTENSAELYDHQVDVLFSGSAGAMRRLVVPPLRKHLKTLERAHVLELGCGPASTTVYLAKAFPKVKITAIDLSSPYVKVAQKRLRKYPRVDALQADAAHLPFKDSSFDAVTSVFMFHELPEDVRLEILREAHRVLKPGGILVLADSIQWNDKENFNWALERFPQNYHEPFFANYIHMPLKKLMEQAGFEDFGQHQRFLAKTVWSRKSSSFKRSNAANI
jgi:ubiquinone/menaquinone biosynthesis C-methylase UbiE